MLNKLLLATLILIVSISCSKNPVNPENNTNHIPTIKSIVIDGFNLIAIASDKDGDILQYVWKTETGSLGDNYNGITIKSYSNTVKFHKPSSGSSIVYCTVVDESGSTSTLSIKVN
jgi:hypothetical protein